MTNRIAVIGAGVTGASIAAALAERGNSVALIDQGAPGSGTSSTSFAWVNSNGKEPDEYFEINRLGIDAHRRLAEAASGNWLGTGGHVEIAVASEHAERLQERIQRLRDRNYPVEVLSPAAASSLLPDIRIPADSILIAHFPEEGFIYPALYIAQALGRARSAGAEIISGKRVVGLEPTSTDGPVDVILEDGTTIQVDRVVSAVGRWTAELAGLAEVTVPMSSFTSPGDITVGYLVETNPVPVRLEQIVTSPEINLRPAGGGRLLLQALDLDTTADPGSVPSINSDLADEFLRRLAAITVGGERATVASLGVGQRAIPEDGRTIAGSLPSAPWLYIVATHSGVTLAPYLGEAVADELAGAQRAELAEFRPSRFLTGSAFIPNATPRHPGEQ